MLPKIKTILYCTDLSENSIYALHHAISLARQYDAKIHMLHVQERLSGDAVATLEAFLMDDETRDKAIHKRKQTATKRLESCIEEFWQDLDEESSSLKKLVSSIEVNESYPAECILQTAKEKNADIIIMAGHNRGISHNFLGSVTKSVLRRSNIPTMVVPLPAL